MTRFARSLASAALATTLTLSAGLAPALAETPKMAKAAPAEKDLIDVAVADGRFKTLAAAVQAAGLVETLKGSGPFTVFAPTDEAFAKLPKGTVDALLADKAKLTAILTYHVVAGKMTSGDVAKARSLKTVQGGSLTVDTTSGVKIDGAKVIVADVPAKNGVIHAIDTVVLPR
jgi:uncharacterized surface protein with fasciclin (FAS1) repeats